MHGKKKDQPQLTEQQVAKKKADAENWSQLWKTFIQMKQTNLKDNNEEESFKLTKTMLEMNPDVYTLWNYRKKLILHKIETLFAQQQEKQKMIITQEQQQEQKNETKNINNNNNENENNNNENNENINKNEKEEKEEKEEKVLETVFDKIRTLFQYELELLQTSLRQHPKSYHVWYQRKWCLLQLREICRKEEAELKGVDITFIDIPTNDLSYWQHELNLCNRALTLDSRNFHCWDYRSFVIKHYAEYSLDKELEYTEEKVGEGAQFFGQKSEKQSFSNYSAWHLRSMLLTKLFINCTSEQIKEKLDAEFELVGQMVMVHNGQSPWLYHRWLVKQVPVEFKEETYKSQLEMCDEIIRMDIEEAEDEIPPSKWASLTKVWLMQALREETNTQEYDELISTVWSQLETNDPMHKNFYKEMRERHQLLLVQ